MPKEVSPENALKEKIEILERLLAEKERVISLYEKLTGNAGFTSEHGKESNL